MDRRGREDESGQEGYACMHSIAEQKGHGWTDGKKKKKKSDVHSTRYTKTPVKENSTEYTTINFRKLHHLQ